MPHKLIRSGLAAALQEGFGHGTALNSLSLGIVLAMPAGVTPCVCSLSWAVWITRLHELHLEKQERRRIHAKTSLPGGPAPAEGAAGGAGGGAGGQDRQLHLSAAGALVLWWAPVEILGVSRAKRQLKMTEQSMKT